MKIGVVSDTHVPDRAVALHPALLSELRRNEVDLILHAGDISTAGVLQELETIAPVKAVSGNRDLLFGGKLERTLSFAVNGVELVLTHGHLNSLTYWWDKIQYMSTGYRRERIVNRLALAFPRAKIIIFGHTHRAEAFWVNGQLFINPGSTSIGDLWVHICSFGIIEIDESGRITSQIIPLQGFELDKRKWKKVEKEVNATNIG